MLACSTVQHSLATHKDFAVRPPLELTNQAVVASPNQIATDDTLTTAAAVEILNDRLKELLELHGVLSKVQVQ